MTTPRHMLCMPERDRIETEVLSYLHRLMMDATEAPPVKQRGAKLPADKPMTADSWWHAGEPQHPGDSPSIGKIANPGRKYYKGLERRPVPVAPRGDVYTEIKKLSLFPNIYNHGR